MAKKKMFEFKLEEDVTEGMKDYFEKVGITGKEPRKADLKARRISSANLLDKIVDGSERNPIKPPILFGALRASGSAHIGNKKAHYTTGWKNVESPEQSTPNTGNGGGKPNEIVIGFNRVYAAKWATTPFNPGPISQIEGPVRFDWLTSHLRTDSRDMMKEYADIIKVETSR